MNPLSMMGLVCFWLDQRADKETEIGFVKLYLHTEGEQKLRGNPLVEQWQARCGNHIKIRDGLDKTQETENEFGWT